MSTTDATHISGNAPQEVKRLLASPRTLAWMHKGFGSQIAARLVVTEVSVDNKAEEPLKKEGRVVCEISVDEDMLNGGGGMHGGCSAYLLDACSTLAPTALSLSMMAPGKMVPVVGVSQSSNFVYHSPAVLGDKLRVVNTTITVGRRTISVRSEIWNVTHHRLVASGVHIITIPSPQKPKL